VDEGAEGGQVKVNGLDGNGGRLNLNARMIETWLGSLNKIYLVSVSVIESDHDSGFENVILMV
jgi:hypothetical protein